MDKFYTMLLGLLGLGNMAFSFFVDAPESWYAFTLGTLYFIGYLILHKLEEMSK